MNEEAILDSYNLFVSKGYSKSIDEFKNLIKTNPQALNDSFSLFASKGYSKGLEEYKNLMGITAQPTEAVKEVQPKPAPQMGQPQKGIQPIPIVDPFKKKSFTVSSVEDGSSVSPTKYPKFVEDQIGQITPELIGMDEEYVVPQLEYQFGPLGFKFEEILAGDYMSVTAPNGKKINITLDPLLSSKEIAESKKLKSFIAENTATIPSLSKFEKEYSQANKKYSTQKEVDESISINNKEEDLFRLNATALVKKIDSFYAEKEALENTPNSERSTPEFQKRYEKFYRESELIKSESQQMLDAEADLKLRSNKLNQAVGKYTAMKAEQGGWLGGLGNRFLKGFGRIGSTLGSSVTDLIQEALPAEFTMGPDLYKNTVIKKAQESGVKLSPSQINSLKSESAFKSWYNSIDEDLKDKIENQVEDEAKKIVKYGAKDEATGERKDGILDPIRKGLLTAVGDDSTTAEWDQLKSQGFWSGAVLGTAESVPAMMGGFAQRTALMYASISDNLNEEMSNNPEFDNISEREKLLITVPIGIAVASLESIGIRNVIANKGLLNGLVMRALGKSGVSTTAKTFGELVKNDVKSGIARGALTLAGGTLAEAETGAAQQIVEVGLKEVYNEVIKKKDMFENPESFSEFVKDVAVAGGQEAVGGFIIGTLPAAAAAYRKQGFKGMSDQEFTLFELAANDTKIEKAFVASLKNDVNLGAMTMEQAKETLNDYRNSVGLFNSLPDNLDIKGKKEAMNLLKEKRDLERQIDGKDDALVVPQKTRIKAINDELIAISERPAEAVVAPTEEEVSVTEIPAEISQLEDDEIVVLRVKNLDEIPEQFRERAKLSPLTEVKTRKKILGLPIGKKGTQLIGGGYRYTLTGKEAKDYAIQEQAAGQVPVQPEATTGEEVEQGKPEAKPKVVTEEGAKAEEVVSIGKDVEVGAKPKPIDEQGILASEKWIKDLYSLPELTRIQDKNGNVYDIKNAKIRKLTLDKEGNVVDAEVIHIDRNIYKKGTYSNPEFFNEGYKVLSEQSPTIQELLTVDTKDETNLQNVYNLLDQLDNDISKRLKGGANEVMLAIPLLTAKAIIKTVKALVSAGMSLQQAIKQAAAENNVTEKDVIDSINLINKEAKVEFVSPVTSTVRITNANIRYDEDLKISEEYNRLLSILSDDTKTEQEKKEAEITISKIIEDQTNYFKDQVNDKLKDINANVATLNTFGYWKGKGEHSFEVQIEADTKEDYFKALGRIADFSSEQSQDAFIEVVPLSEADVAELQNEDVEILNTKMEDNSNVTQELTFEFENTLSLSEVSELSSALSDKGVRDFTASKNNFSVIYLSDNPSKSDYDQWLDAVDETFKNFFNGKTNNFSGYASSVRTWVHTADSQDTRSRTYKSVKTQGQDTRSRTYKSVKNNLQKRYEAQPGYGNKRASDQGDNGKQAGEQEGSRDDIGGPDVNNTLDTQQFFTDVENGKHKPSKDLEFVLPLSNALKKIHQVWSKFKGNFDEHIETNIPVFREIQIRKINAILAMLPNGGNIIDLGGSTGSFVKTITSFNPKIKSENLDANDRMEETHNAIPVKNAVFVKKLFAETYEGAEVDVYEPTEKFDVVHESMLFQFIKEDRAKFIDEIADKYVKDDGIVIIEEKLIGKNFEANETNKDQNFKLKYYDKKYLDKKKEEVLFGMKNNQATQLELEDQLNRRFKYVSQYWDGGNFKGYVASNSEAKIDKFLSEMGDTSSEFSSQKAKVSVGKTVSDLMTADTKDATVLENVLGLLNKADDDISKRLKTGGFDASLALPLIAIKAIIKSVKLLVKAGMSLQEAIKQAAADNNVTEKDVVASIQYLAEQRDLEAKPQGVSEMELPGYNQMMSNLNDVIETSKRGGANETRVMENAIAYLQGSKVYQEASDTQREQMVRDVRKMFGKKEKSAPKPAKLFGEIKDVKMITMSEYDLLMKQLSDEARTSKNTKTLWMRTSAELTKYIKKMQKNGHITIKQASAVLRKFSNVNMFNDASINSFVNYMQKVFNDANYADQIAKVRASLKVAKKNIQTKLGTAQTLYPLLSRMLAINPTLIPDAVFDRYVEIVTAMGERKTVLTLEESGQLTDAVEDILAAVNEEVSKSEELAELFDLYANKIVDANGKVSFANTVLAMVEDGSITEKDAELMRKYKSKIMPPIPATPKSEAEIQAEKDLLITAIQDIATIDVDGLPMKDERDKARELERLIQTNAVGKLDNAQLINLLRVIENINNGYFPHYAELVIERLNAKNESVNLDNAIQEAKPLPITSAYARLKKIFTKKDAFTEMIRSTPLFFIGQVFGDFKSKTIFNAIFEKAAEAQSMFKRSINELNNKLDKAEEAVAQSFGLNGNKITMSKYKMMTFMLQLEYESNPETNKVNQASEYLKKTIAHILKGKSNFTKRDADMLQEILKDYSTNGNIDSKKLYNSFNSAEKNAIKVIQDINSGLREKAIFTAAVIRGDKIHPLDNYIHHNVLHDYKPEESISGAAFIDQYNQSLRPSTKAKSLIERKVGVTPLNFDVFASANRGAKFTLMDYYLTVPIRTARKTLNETDALMNQKIEERDERQKQNPLSKKEKEKQDKSDQTKRDIFNAIDNAFEEAVDNLLSNNFTSSSFGDQVANFMSKQGYRAVLASLPRFAAELSSNVAFAMIAAPQDFKAGVGLRGIVFSADASTIMNNLKSKQTNRIFPNDTLSGRLIDSSIMSQAVGVKGSRANRDVANKIQQIYNLSLKKYQNVVEVMADSLISTPDKMVMRPMWFGAFSNEFKKLTGKEIDFDKVAANDEMYMSENKDALDSARNIADEKTVLTGAADNAFMGRLKGSSKPNQTAMLRFFNMFNNFMSTFLVYEYNTARTGVMAAMGNGSISRKQGVALLAAVTTRMTLYTLLSTTLSNALVGMFVGNGDDDDEKSLLQKFGQSLASGFTSLVLGRDFGNATKAVINTGVEYVNENFLDFLREGKYDPYKDAIQYTIMPPERKGKPAAFADMIINMFGPFGPSIKTMEFAFKKVMEPDKKEYKAIERAEKEKSIRLPLEILGNLGLIPLYKDIRKIVNKEIYKDLEKAESATPAPKKMSKEDMKTYFPDMYNDLYGPGGALYDVELIKKEIRKEKEKMRKEMKDEMYLP